MWFRERYKELARDMQRLESQMMINEVCARLFDRFPEIKLVTVHDSVITTAKYVEAVKSEIENAYLQRLSIKPKVTAKNDCKYDEILLISHFNPVQVSFTI